MKKSMIFAAILACGLMGGNVNADLASLIQDITDFQTLYKDAKDILNQNIPKARNWQNKFDAKGIPMKDAKGDFVKIPLRLTDKERALAILVIFNNGIMLTKQFLVLANDLKGILNSLPSPANKVAEKIDEPIQDATKIVNQISKGINAISGLISPK